ncbi:CDGSH iron sulfur domain 2 [Brevipalpus obovatus]|uniref:CDGSH iron sulfur domain 2 n=1 Tax=Brevipalpus obovatus TaxID=246614 RepID=UPI003D9ECDB2
MCDSMKDHGHLVAYGAAIAAIVYAVYTKYQVCKAAKSSRVNNNIQKDNSKVVHTFDVEDLDNKSVFCRCWRSKKFPYCDGAHNKHNEATGDNVGPLIVQKKAL